MDDPARHEDDDTAGAGPETAKTPPKKGGRDARLKSALKANLARRKAQARGRADDNGTDDGEA